MTQRNPYSRLAATLIAITATISMVGQPIVTTPDGISLEALSDNTAQVVLGDDFYTGSVVVPATDGHGRRVVAVGHAAFNACHSLKTVALPEGITIIGDYAFNACDVLTDATLPPTVTHIGHHAFARCEALRTIDIPDAVTFIGDYAFFRCKQVTAIALGSGVTHIGAKAFTNCNQLKAITVAAGNSAYRDENGTLLTADGATLVAFPRKHPDWRGYDVPTTVTHIADFAFYGSDNMKTLTLPAKLQTIGEWAFGGCRSLKSVTLPATITALGANAFDGCRALTAVHCLRREPLPLDSDRTPFGFFTDLSGITLYVPEGTAWLYASAPVWSTFGNIEEEESSSVRPISVTDDHPSVTIDGRSITVAGLAKGSSLMLYDLQGRLVAHNPADDSALHTPSAGIYILRASNGWAQKVVVR